MNLEINLEAISKQCPEAYALCKVTLGENIHDDDKLFAWMRDKNLRLKVSMNVLNKNWFYEVFLRPKDRNYVRKHGIVDTFEEAWDECMMEAWLLLEYEVKPKKGQQTILDTITAKQIRRAQQIEYMKDEMKKKHRKK